MTIKEFNLTVILVIIIAKNSNEFRFMRRIQAIGTPYYKILMSLGICKESILYFDQKIYGKVPLNRVLDIYYKHNNENFKVSRVEIKLVINNTSSFAYSEAGVGFPEFRATLYLPTHLNFVLYTITIYTCNREKNSSELRHAPRINADHKYMPFLFGENNEYFL